VSASQPPSVDVTNAEAKKRTEMRISISDVQRDQKGCSDQGNLPSKREPWDTKVRKPRPVDLDFSNLRVVNNLNEPELTCRLFGSVGRLD
jgi:hypothetical protein